MADTSGSVTVETREDAEAVLMEYFRGGLQKPFVPTTRTGLPVKGELLLLRQNMVISGNVVLFSGERYKDRIPWGKGCNRLASTTCVALKSILLATKDGNFLLSTQDDMSRRTIAFKYYNSQGILMSGILVSYQATDRTHPNASSVFKSPPEHEPPRFELMLNAVEQGDLASTSAHAQSQMTSTLPSASVGETASQWNLQGALDTSCTSKPHQNGREFSYACKKHFDSEHVIVDSLLNPCHCESILNCTCRKK